MTGKDKIRIFDYFFVLRPTLFFPVWTLTLAGCWAQQRFQNTAESMQSASSIAIALFTCIMGSVFLINQIKDVETDRLNNKLYLIASGDVPLRHAWIETVLLLVLPVIIAAIWKWELAAVMVLTFVILGWFYSCAPFSLKDRPVGGIAANLCGGYLVFCYGWMIAGTPGLLMLLHATPYAMGLVAAYFFTTLPDVEGDRAAKKVTAAVRYGIRMVLLAGLIAACIAVFMAAVARDLVIFIPTFLSLPYFVKAYYSKQMADVLQTSKFATLFLSLAVCVKFYLYLPIIIIVYLFSKWYYKKRFNILYPSFRT